MNKRHIFSAPLVVAVLSFQIASVAVCASELVYLTIDESHTNNQVQDGSFTLNVWVSLTEETNAGTLGFAWSDSANWKVDSVIAGPAISHLEIQGPVNLTTINTNSRVLIGAAGIFKTISEGDDQLWGSVYFSLTQLNTWTAGDAMWFDSSYIPPAGDFLLVQTDGDNITPEFAGALMVEFSDVDDYESGAELPKSFSLSQNYPNPFNPTTVIQYSIPKQSHLSLEIYNALGQKIITLVDEQHLAGSYTIEWNGKSASGVDVASGLYLYRLKTNDFVKSRKMLLLK